MTWPHSCCTSLAPGWSLRHEGPRLDPICATRLMTQWQASDQSCGPAAPSRAGLGVPPQKMPAEGHEPRTGCSPAPENYLREMKKGDGALSLGHPGRSLGWSCHQHDNSPGCWRSAVHSLLWGGEGLGGSWHAGPTAGALLQQQQPHCETGDVKRGKPSPHPAQAGPAAWTCCGCWGRLPSSGSDCGQGTLPAKPVPRAAGTAPADHCWATEGPVHPCSPRETPCLPGMPRPPLLGGGIRRSWQRQAGFVICPLPQRLSWCKHDPEAGHCHKAILQQECQRGPSAPAGGCADRGLGAS